MVNASSSSVKYEIVDTESRKALVRDKIERIREMLTHVEAVAQVVGAARNHVVAAVGHPVVHGGDKFHDAVRALVAGARPYRRFRAFRVAEELLDAVRDARIRDRVLREQALKSAKSACLNAEGAGRTLSADKARAYGIARAECVEAVAATEIAVRAGDAAAGALPRVLATGSELYAVLGALIR